MKNKLFIFVILILMLLSVSAVCAEDASSLNLNETNVATTNSVPTQNIEQDLVEDTLEEDIDLNNIDMSNEITNKPNAIYVNPVKGDDNNNGSNWDNSVKTINTALTLVKDNGVIYLAEGEYTTPAKINKNITLIGQNRGKTVLTNNATDYFLIIESSKTTFKIYNCTFLNNKRAIAINPNAYGNRYYIDNCYFMLSGGMEMSNADLTICNSIFKHNLPTNYNGGVVYMNGGNVNISNSTFERNTATSGGAIYINNGNVTITNSTYIRNVAKSYGGAILVSGGNVTITNSTYINNEAKESGGAVDVYGGSFTVSNSVFVNNTATISGGAVDVDSGNFTVSSSVFVNNTAKNQGGAISINKGKHIGVNGNWWGSNAPDWNSLIFGTSAPQSFAVLDVSFNETSFNVYNVIARFCLNGTQTVVNIPTRDIKFKCGSEVISGKIIGGMANETYALDIGDEKDIAVSVDNETQNVILIGKRITPNMTISLNDIVYGESGIIRVNLSALDIGGKLTIYVDDVSTEVDIVNGFVTVIVFGLNAGSHEISAVFAGNQKYTPVNSTATLNVAKAIPELDVVIKDVDYGNVLTINATLKGVNGANLTGDVVISINGKNYTVKVVDGKGNLTGIKLLAGNYDFNAVWSGDNNYNSITDSGRFNVNKINTTMDIIVPKDIKAGEDIIIVINVPEDATGEVNVEIGGKTYTAGIVNGSVNLTTSPLNVGNYTLTVTYNGNNEYNPMTKKANITVISNIDVNLNVEDIVMFYHDGTRLIAILTDCMGNPIANATIYFTINGVIYSKPTNATGGASIALNLNSGIYNASILFNGSDIYDKSSKNITITIKSTIDGQNIVKFYQNGTQFFATFIDTNGNILVNTNVTFNINGVFYTRSTDEKGTARLAINLRPGEYILTALNPNSTEQKGFNITVKSLIEASDLTKYFQNASKFEAKIYNQDGSLAVNQNVTFNINGVFYNRTTDNKGIVSLDINLRPGNYTITTIYGGLDIGNTVKVLSTLETNDLSMDFGDGSQFQAKTLDGQGKPLANQNVTFNVNGVFYHKVTDNNGVASLNINLNPGEYIITSIWNNYQVGNKITIA